MPSLLIRTIGHSNHAVDRFIGLLGGQGVTLLVDVRSQPASRHVPQYNRPALAAALAAAGIDYLWLGEALGGRPRDPAVYRPDGRPDYMLCAARPAFIVGIGTLLQAAGRQPAAIMCAERNPRHCHRTHLVTPALLARGAEVCHILADGSSLDHAALQHKAGSSQLDLFG